MIDTDSAKIKVKNKIKDMKYHQDPDADGKLLPFSTDFGTYYFGANRCAKESFDPNVVDHWIHKPGDGKVVDTKQVNDPGGPYDGMFYVTSHNLVVTRHMFINSHLLTGDVAKLNQRAHEKDLNKIVSATLDHERIHGDLVEKVVEAKKQMKFLQELAKLVDTSDQGLQGQADTTIGDGETVLKNASSESKVQAELRKIYKGKKATIIRPGNEQPFEYTLATIGDVETDPQPAPPEPGPK